MTARLLFSCSSGWRGHRDGSPGQCTLHNSQVLMFPGRIALIARTTINNSLCITVAAAVPGETAHCKLPYLYHAQTHKCAHVSLPQRHTHHHIMSACTHTDLQSARTARARWLQPSKNQIRSQPTLSAERPCMQSSCMIYSETHAAAAMQLSCQILATRYAGAPIRYDSCHGPAWNCCTTQNIPPPCATARHAACTDTGKQSTRERSQTCKKRRCTPNTAQETQKCSGPCQILN
jgi:hypothetical protein